MFSLEINCETQEVIERPYTAKEIQQWEVDNAELQSREQLKLEAAVKRQALLAKLGITEEEARLLLGGN